jgi:hypothetical protein
MDAVSRFDVVEGGFSAADAPQSNADDGEEHEPQGADAFSL